MILCQFNKMQIAHNFETIKINVATFCMRRCRYSCRRRRRQRWFHIAVTIQCCILLLQFFHLFLIITISTKKKKQKNSMRNFPFSRKKKAQQFLWVFLKMFSTNK